jgi:glycosyltransferase involved in cell wall biosynthesis
VSVIHIISSLEGGGAEATLYRLCEAEQRSGRAHTVVSLMGRGVYARRLEEIGVAVHCLSMPRRRVTLRALYQLFRLLRRLRPDVVQTWMYHADLLGGVLAKLAGVKSIIWSIRGPLDSRETSRATAFVARCCALLSRYVPTRIVSCSVLAARVHQNLGYERDKFVIIPNGYPLDRFRPMPDQRRALRTTLRVDETMPLLGMVARFDPYKDHQNLFAALGLLRREEVCFRCLLIGDGMEESNAVVRVLTEREGLGDRVLLLGRREDIPSLMNAMDIHVLSSLNEAFPNVLAEAMACGTPCVTTDVGDARLIVGDTGWIAPPRDAVGLASAIRSAIAALSHGQDWQRRRTECRHRVETHFDLNRMWIAYRDVWGFSDPVTSTAA